MHALTTDDDTVFYSSNKFNKDEIKAAILTFLKSNPLDTCYHEKEGVLINAYCNNPKNGKPSKIVQFRGSEKIYYKSLG